MTELDFTNQHSPSLMRNQPANSNDVVEFRINSFEKIRNEFAELAEFLKSKEGLVSEFFQKSDTEFSCYIINRNGQTITDSSVIVSMSNGNSDIADLSFEFNKIDNNEDKIYYFNIISGENGLLLRDQRSFGNYAYRVGNASQLASEMQDHLLKLAGINFTS